MQRPDDKPYTSGGPPAVEARIASDQQRVAAEIARLVPAQHLRALILAGGYGRGEGGFRGSGDAALPYNDYDYFIVVKGLGAEAVAPLKARLHRLATALDHEFAMEVDFAVLEAERLHRLPACLMYSELKWSHRTLLGDPAALEAIASPPVEQLPLAEFSRMMLNRGALLLMNARALFCDPVADVPVERFFRYFSKGVLAAGDARLAAAGRYHPSSVERATRLRDLAWVGPGRKAFDELYEFATHIKLGGVSPAEMHAGDFSGLQRAAVGEWLAAYRLLEAARLGHALHNWQSYARASVGKGQGGQRWWSPAHHLALALTRQSRQALRSNLGRMLRHPRERLMSALPLLLEPGVAHADPRACEALGAPPGLSWPGLADRFLDDWRRYC